MSDESRRSRDVGRNKGILLSVRVDQPLRDAIRQHRERLQAESPYRQLSDSDAVRDLLLRALGSVTKGGPRKVR